MPRDVANMKIHAHHLRFTGGGLGTVILLVCLAFATCIELLGNNRVAAQRCENHPRLVLRSGRAIRRLHVCVCVCVCGRVCVCVAVACFGCCCRCGFLQTWTLMVRKRSWHVPHRQRRHSNGDQIGRQAPCGDHDRQTPDHAWFICFFHQFRMMGIVEFACRYVAPCLAFRDPAGMQSCVVRSLSDCLLICIDAVAHCQIVR